MGEDDEHEKKIVETLEDIHELEIEALRRAGVAKEKVEGYRIESVEALRLFKEADGYLLRLRRLQDMMQEEMNRFEYYHIERVLGHIDDYNRILGDIRNNPSFENAVSSFDEIEYRESPRGGYDVSIADRSIHVKASYSTRNATRRSQNHDTVPMDGRTTVENAILPRLFRLAEDLEQSLIGRCQSGKRP